MTRISDVERQRAIDELARHLAAGRIDLEGYEDRVAEASSATDLTSLDRSLRDLPMVKIADPGSDPRSDHLESDSLALNRLGSKAIAVGAVMALVIAVIIGVLVEWEWALLLVVGWIAGILQGRIIFGRRGRS